MSLQVNVTVNQSLDDNCNTILFQDTTCEFDALLCPCGYGGNNFEKEDIVSTIIQLQAPGSKTWVTIDKAYLPTQEDVLEITCDDWADAIDEVVIEESDDEDECVSCGSKITSEDAGDCFHDGCWKIKYQVLALPVTCEYDLGDISFSATLHSITINGEEISFGDVVVDSIEQLVALLNSLDKGTFGIVSSIFIQVVGEEDYGDLLINQDNEPVTLQYACAISSDTPEVVSEITQTVFFSCQVTKQLKNLLLMRYKDDCNCKGTDLDSRLSTLNMDYQTMILAAQSSDCDCVCATQYLKKLNRQMQEVINECK